MEIYATNISNLTDARYFAALGASHLGVNIALNDMNITEYMAMKEWISGPIWVWELEEELSDAQHEIVQLSKVKTFCVPFKEKDSILNGFISCSLKEYLELSTHDLQSGNSWIIKIYRLPLDKEVVQVQRMAENSKVYLWFRDILENRFIQLIHDVRPKGIVLQGSEGNRTGYKSFDDIEVFLNALNPI